ncbi:MAG: formate/nitrite transporter family protein [Erysipelotrichaceae bacterium]|nr:formate/nitrite transporter family protein [Erysipelotrichaceae bacterium]
MINTPKEILAVWIQNSKNKAALSPLKMVLLGMLAGMYIGFGCHVFVLATAAETTVLTKLIGAALFPAGLMMVIFCGAELFTGNNLMTLAVMSGDISLKDMLRNWGLVYLGNFIGSVLLAFLLAKSGLYTDAAAVRAVALASSKASMPFVEALIRGILCNILVVLACWFQAGAKEMAGKILAVWFPITLFVFAGFEHSVANMTYIPLGMFLGADVSVVSFLLGSLLPVTAGNLIGGALFIPAIYTTCYRK